ncbi:MAG: cytochrome c biogenesis protein CcsA [Chitinophagales bacterium]
MEEITHQHVVQQVNPIFGQIGHIFVLIAFITAAFGAIYYFLSVRSKEEIRSELKRKIGRYFFITHAVAVIGIVVTLFIMIFNHHFEYHYVWSHSSTDLQMKYILSCFWEGQEGSFLLWAFWHVVLGIILLFRSKKWESPVMTIVCLMQVFLLSYLLGIYIGEDRHIGNSPFLLLKDKLTTDPVFLFQDYMRFVPDGRGLNALLQNYWMVIHPPVLFCGFASITIPFAYLFAGLWTKKYAECIKPAIPYALFSGMVLGTGILMGGAWAYESLSFGGFWAWDPVENASLIPWLIIVAALHNLVIAKSTGHAMRSSFVMVFLSFYFVLYASFLTRSGILGDTSVHAFVEEGLTNHLLLFFFFFVIISLFLLIKNWKKIPVKEKEESLSSREFWMFVGSLVLLFAGLHIIFFTSIPVYNVLIGHVNDIFNSTIKDDFGKPPDEIHFYTGVQIWVGILIAILSGFSQFLRYKKSETKHFFKTIALPLIFALIAAVISSLLLDKIWHITAERGIFHLVTAYSILFFAAWFSVIANMQYLFTVLKGKIKVAGGSVAHIGFGILLLGILISNAGQRVISENKFGVQFDDGSGMDKTFQRENVRLIRNAPFPMKDYLVTYLGDSIAGGATYYNLLFQKIDPETNKIEQEFKVHPYLLMDTKMQQLAPNPDTKHFLTYDVFTHVSSLPGEGSKNAEPQIQVDTVSIGDTIKFNTGYFVLNDIERFIGNGDSIGAGAKLKAVVGIAHEDIEVKYILSMNDSTIIQGTAHANVADVSITFSSILPVEKQFIFTVTDKSLNDDWIVVKSIIFPMINLVWIGIIIMAIGFLISLIRRNRENKLHIS